jgi:hypothetical protein
LCVSCMIMGYIYSFGSLFCIRDLILGMLSLVGVVDLYSTMNELHIHVVALFCS